jgi:DNA-binding GntR family transcriptional regulator
MFKLQQSIRELQHIVEQIERQQFELAADLLRAHLRQLSFGRPRVVGRSIPPMPS